jgi:uncharacterized protein (TIGR02231 family)
VISSSLYPTQVAVETGIVAVTVYTDQARVTRRGKISLSGGEQVLIVTALPTTLKAESIRAGGMGTSPVRILGVQTERVIAREPVEERVAQLTQQIQQLEDQQRMIEDGLNSEMLQREFVKDLLQKSVDRFAQRLAQQQVGLNQTRDLIDFAGRHYQDCSASIVQRQREQKDLIQQLTTLRQQLHQIQTPRPRESFTLKVGIEPSGAGDFELEISYVVDRAAWKPLFDLRVSAPADQLNLTYLAEVKQTTGEEWTDAELTFSTAKPGLGTLPPKLDPWYIDVMPPVYPQVMMAAAPTMMRSKRSQTSEASLSITQPDFEKKLEMQMEAISAGVAVAEVAAEAGVVTFKLDRPSTIPSDGDPHKVTLLNQDYECHPSYIAMPKRISFAYLQAKVTNPTDAVTLLPGSGNIFRENTFVGTVQLDNISPGQDFHLNLGIDEGLKIQRDLIERQVDKKLLSLNNIRRITYAYRIQISNLRSQAALLTLTEQLPVSRNEKIKVRLTRIDPQLQTGELGQLEWTLDLPAMSQRTLTYQFIVEYPPELTLSGLDI